ncbi:hypothetical protein JFV26_32100 [Pseudomonas sp. TH31]|nr:hypothetical protein [Pseudomonas sp. TH31]MBK5418506.1 hypothetical protein [Pseudomonas sp. TH31]
MRSFDLVFKDQKIAAFGSSYSGLSARGCIAQSPAPRHLRCSAIAPLIRLSYGRMVWMALPYTMVMGSLGWYAVSFWL